MEDNFSNYTGANQFDCELDKTPHFIKFPEMKPWIGNNYSIQQLKLLIIGESHYFAKGTEFHHDAKAWYEKKFDEDLSKRQGHRVRYQISKGFGKKGAHVMYKRINKALVECNFVDTDNAFKNIAYINYFQRPAENTGKSISINQLDKDIASETINGVIRTLKPSLILFTSVKAYQVAKQCKAFKGLNSQYDYTAHPCSAYWNRKSKKYGKFSDENIGELSGKDRFKKLVRERL